MLNEPSKRTDKVFEDYNDYHDRGMIKWVTAYAMDELVKSISAGKAEALKDIPILPQLSPAEIDAALAEALKKNRRVSIQLNQKDSFGRQTESIEGFFKGYCGEDEILIGEEWIALDSIRNVKVLQADKWSSVTVFKQQSY